MTKRIRITGSGIYGQPTEENPSGEYPIGFEFDTEADFPAGWAGRAVVVGDGPVEGSELIINEGDETDVGKARNEVIAKAQEHIDGLKAEHAKALKSVNDRADKAEKDLAAALATVDGLKAELAKLGNGGDEAAKADEIQAAVGLLDAKNEAHWTKAGLPAVEAVAELTGKAVTREAIESAAPDAKRPTE